MDIQNRRVPVLFVSASRFCRHIYTAVYIDSIFVEGLPALLTLANQYQPKDFHSYDRRNSRVFVSGDLRNLGSKHFYPAVESALADVQETLGPSHPLHRTWNAFYRRITQAAQLQADLDTPPKGDLQTLRTSLYRAFQKSGIKGIREELYIIQKNDEFASSYGNPHLEEQKKAVDLRYPAEWYPHTRSMQRTIHLHVGPTNSGKTYRALKRLEQAQRGFYAGPLRLLAQEVYSRFTADGIPCALVTGDEVRIPDSPPRIFSNTVEMVTLSQNFEVGVIDEIQMISDPDRGWAWTKAFLGARAKELHVCGEERTVPLIKELASLTGDILEIHRYQRLNPLKVESTSLRGDLRKLRKGDCVVSFSRLNIHALKNEIEKVTGKRAAVVYGGLPAEIRTQQANLFNDPDNDYHFLVASDAIGMGLNLKCKRVIFQTLIKGAKGNLKRISIPQIKQIGGRAGRFRAANETQEPNGSQEPNVGLVTSLEDVDLPYIQRAMEFEPAPLTAAGIIPTDTAFQRIAPYFPAEVPFKFLVNRVFSLAQTHPLFFMCRSRAQIASAEIIDRSHQLNIDDRLIFMAAPINDSDPVLQRTVRGYIRALATNNSGRLLDIPEINLEVLELPVSGNREYLNDLESLHKSLIIYLWLSYRVGGVFTDRTLAMHVKTMVEERMMRALAEFSANKKLRRDASLRRQIVLERRNAEQERLLSATEGSNETSDPSSDAFDMPIVEDTSSHNEAQSRNSIATV
ncbi:hypothetical protein UA08_03554 [Talaromyces atroroseus]|uniref:RNA helicase n=1 Tax=Talaromyces atroroseus TaxID=1441469 RepID=A0A225ASI9_TALAT|nr:hypothetical protein UA08_03554 [Talaromyces atroroseus]OKL61314.1 hypothetical protein UA08_03554 [Talaromyces atroroseus]